MSHRPSPAQNEQPASSTPRYVLPETTAIAAVGCVDLIYTVYLVGSRQAVEANRLFASIMAVFGPWGFVAAKAAFLAGPLALAESVRAHREQFVRQALRVGFVLYLLIYGLLWIRHNG